MEISEFYLRPPTLGELAFAIGRLGDYLYVFDLEDKPDVWNLLFNKFELPPSCRSGSGSDSDLGKLICNLEDGTDYNLHLPGPEHSEAYYSCLFWRLSPETTLALGNGDCKSLAVISVAYKRLHGIPARFLASQQDHIIFEEYDGNVWVPKEPQMARFSAQMEDLNGLPVPIANPSLYERTYVHFIQLFSEKHTTGSYKGGI